MDMDAAIQVILAVLFGGWLAHADISVYAGKPGEGSQLFITANTQAPESDRTLIALKAFCDNAQVIGKFPYRFPLTVRFRERQKVEAGGWIPEEYDTRVLSQEPKCD